LDGKTKATIGGGIALDVAGLALAATSPPEADWRMGVGLALMLAGTWLISTTVRGAVPTEASPEDVEKARGRWRPEPELRNDPPRRVRLSPMARVAALAWLLMLGIGGAYAYVMVFGRNPAPPSRNLLDAEGARAQATIHRREVRENAGGEPRYVLYYNFKEADGTAVRSSVNVSKMLFERYHEGDRFEVAYIEGDPLAHYVPGLTRPAFAERGLLMALVVLAFLLYLLESRRRRHLRLVRQGSPVPGVVENLKRRGGTRVYDVLFQVNGRNGMLRASERNRRRRNGDIVTVLCDRGANDAEVYHQCLYRAQP
jgi:hypothetical protein